MIYPNWYFIDGKWYHCICIDGISYVNGVMQNKVFQSADKNTVERGQ